MEAARREAIRSMLAVAREAVPEVEPEPSDSALEAVSGALVELASHTALWPLEEFEAQLEAQSEPGSGTAAPSELWTQLAADADPPRGRAVDPRRSSLRIKKCLPKWKGQGQIIEKGQHVARDSAGAPRSMTMVRALRAPAAGGAGCAARSRRRRAEAGRIC